MIQTVENIGEKLISMLTYDASQPLIFSSGLFLFLFAGFLFFYGFTRRAPIARHPLFALLLLQVERHLLPAARLRFSERLLDRPCHLQSADATGEILARGIEHIGQSGHVGLFQIYEFPDRNRQQPLRTRVPQLPEHLPAGRYFVLRIPVDELYDRHLPGTTQTPEQLGRLPVLSLVLPATGSRPDRPGQRLHSPDPTKPAAGHARNVRHGRIPDPDRLIQKSRHFGLYLTSSIVSSTSRCSTPGSNA